jgi:translation initiation factor IF-2
MDKAAQDTTVTGTGATKKPKTAPRKVPTVTLPNVVTVKQLASLLDVNAVEIIKQLMRNGIMANINQTIDFSIAAAVAAAYGFKAEKQKAKAKAKTTGSKQEGNLVSRPPVITIMGHVDHGKTSLLDAIRRSNVIDTEAGAITQHIGAYQVEMEGRKITFLDTPGHEAFTAMRARGARVTDIAVLVVAADDGVMPQTLEAINHAQAAEVPIIVALNKIDKANANPDHVKQQLADAGVLIEEWGGETVCVPVSAKKKEGIEDLLENLLLVADILELKAEANCPAEGVVIEAKLDKTKGSLATLLVKKGTLHMGDTIVVGNTFGKVKAMLNDSGKRIKIAEPSTPVEILGINEVPVAGDFFQAVSDDREAKALLEKQRSAQQDFISSTRTLSLSDFSAQVMSGSAKELDIVLKTDVQGSIEPIRDSLERLSDEHVKVKVIHANSGSITESDVMLALASQGIIIGFNSRPDSGAQRLAEMEGISIRFYDVIYGIIDDVEKAMKGMLEPTYADAIDGYGEVRAVFDVGKKGNVAGIVVKDGKAIRDAFVRVMRDGKVIHESRVNSLKRFKNDAKEVATGLECGVGVDDFEEFQAGDILQFYHKEKVT